MRIILLLGMAVLRGLRRGWRGSDDGRTSVVASFYPLAFAAEQVGGPSVARSQPHAARSRAARPRGDARRRPGAPRRGSRASARRGLPAAARGRCGRRRPRRSTSSTRLVSTAWRTATSTSGSTRCATPFSSSGSATRSAVRTRPQRLVRRLRSARPRLPGGARRLRPPRDRHEPRGLRLPRGSLRARADPDHRAVAPKASRRRATSSERSTPCARPARRRSSSSRSSRHALLEAVAREAGAQTAVLNPIEGLTESEQDGGADYFSLMRANLATLRKALACR